MGGVGGGLGVIIESNLNRVRLSCCWVGVGLGCDNLFRQRHVSVFKVSFVIRYFDIRHSKLASVYLFGNPYKVC